MKGWNVAGINPEMERAEYKRIKAKNDTEIARYIAFLIYDAYHSNKEDLQHITTPEAFKELEWMLEGMKMTIQETAIACNKNEEKELENEH